MITREQVADLQPGDVVELRDCRHADLVTTGPVTVLDGVRRLGPWNLIGHPVNPEQWSLTVVSRAPRPLYVNNPRTEPVPGDVVRDADSDDTFDVWLRSWGGEVQTWLFANQGAVWLDDEMPARLRLLVDGETGRVVP